MNKKTFIVTLYVAVFTMSVMMLHAGPYNTNLLSNPGFESGWDSWTSTNGGNGWNLVTTEPASPESPFGSRWVVSSYAWCTYSQEIDLLAAGFTPEELDTVPFTIDYHTWVSTYWGGRYYITIEARNASHGIIAQSNIGTEAAYITLPDDTNNWERTLKSHADRFTVNNTGVRFIYFKVGGRDTRNWAGYYGTAFDENYVGINNSFDPPQPRTNPVTDVGYTSAKGNGYMEALGIDNPTQHGHCWNTTGMPTVDDSKTTLGATPRLVNYTSNLTGLNPETQYFVRSYATNSAGTAYGEEVSFTTSLGVTNLSPQNNAVNMQIRPEISWEATGIAPDGFKLYLGTDNPPTELVYEGSLTSYQPENQLLYNQLYYWRVDPYVGEDSGQGNLWSFTTTDIYESGAVTGLVDIEPVVSLPNVNGDFTPDISTGWALPDAPFSNDGLYIIISGVPMNGRLVVINPDLGFVPQNVAYRILPSLDWQIVPAKVDWTATYVYFTVMEAKSDGDLIILFPDSEDSTLPVELSSFAAVLTAEDLVMLTWTTQSETNLSGYKVYRNNSGLITTAMLISPLIPAHNSSTVQNYNFIDGEILEAGTYYYWLESLDMDGFSNYFGPTQLLVANHDNNTPELPMATTLLSAYPNPFNPVTSLRYQLDKAADVRMDIFNSKGQLVRSFQASHSQGGLYSFLWDGRDQSGRTVTSGIYFYHMSSGNYKAARKMVLLK